MTLALTPLWASLVMNERLPRWGEPPVMPAHLYKMPNSWQSVFAENAVCFCAGSKGDSGARL